MTNQETSQDPTESAYRAVLVYRQYADLEGEDMEVAIHQLAADLILLADDYGCDRVAVETLKELAR